MDERDLQAINKDAQSEVMPCVTRCFSSKEELAKHIEMHMPFAVRPTKKAKTVFINPFTSYNARQLCIESIVKCLLK